MSHDYTNLYNRMGCLSGTWSCESVNKHDLLWCTACCKQDFLIRNHAKGSSIVQNEIYGDGDRMFSYPGMLHLLPL